MTKQQRRIRRTRNAFVAAVAIIVVIVVVLARTTRGGRWRAPETPVVATDPLPMPPDDAIAMMLAGNYGFMSLQFKVGDTRSFAGNYAAEAVLSVTGLGTLHGRRNIELDFAGEGARLAVDGFDRVSEGYRVEGREVLDSGRYEFVRSLPLADTVLDVRGRYWTRWRYGAEGGWLILRDSLVGEGRR